MDFQPIGFAARAFLRRFKDAGELVTVEGSELNFAKTCLDAGYLTRIGVRGYVFQISEQGIAYLDRLARCE